MTYDWDLWPAIVDAGPTEHSAFADSMNGMAQAIADLGASVADGLAPAFTNLIASLRAFDDAHLASLPRHRRWLIRAQRRVRGWLAW